MGFSEEAEAYMSFISDRLKHSRDPKTGALPIMFSIRGSTDLPEIELTHLDGHRSSRPVRIGNGAAFHKQLDIYGELMDSIYLYNKYGKPVSYDQWCAVREMTDYVCTIWEEPDMSMEVAPSYRRYVLSLDRYLGGSWSSTKFRLLSKSSTVGEVTQAPTDQKERKSCSGSR